MERDRTFTRFLSASSGWKGTAWEGCLVRLRYCERPSPGGLNALAQSNDFSPSDPDLGARDITRATRYEQSPAARPLVRLPTGTGEVPYSSPVIKLDAILPAGGVIEPEFAAKVGTSVKALIQIDGATVLQRTIDAVRQTGLVRRMVVIGSAAVGEAVAGQHDVLFLPEAKTGPENIYNGLHALGSAEDPATRLLVVTTDQPFLTPKMIADFIAACPPSKQICVPLIRESEYQARFPGTLATFVRLKEETWTTGGVFLVEVDATIKAKPHVEKVFENRKSKFGMAKLLGAGFAYKWLANKLTLADVEKKIEQLLGASGAAVTGCAPELAYDIDDIDDYEMALRFATTQELAQ